MKTLCVCATYGRLPLLPVMLSSFLEQTYDDKRLVIINDDINVELCCRFENVTVLNCNRRLLLSQKRNIGIASGYEDLIFPMDDDDVFLPNRIANHVANYKGGNSAYRNTSCYWTYDEKFFIGTGPPNDISFLRKVWFEIGGYATRGERGEDTELFDKIPNKLIVEDKTNKDFVYGFSGVNYHLSAGHSMSTIEERAINQLKDMNLFGRKYWIEPDFEEYQKYLILASTYDRIEREIPIGHPKLGNIDISECLKL